MKSAALLVLAALPAAGPALAQRGADPPRVSGSVETAILEIDAFVTDKSGKPVTGLKAADFEVKVGGRRVAIENFYERRPLAPGGREPVPEGGAPVPSPVLVPAARPPRHLVLFVDRVHLVEKWKSDATFDALRRVLREVVTEPGDDAMVVTWDQSVGPVVPFTSDLERIERVLAREQRLSRSPLPEDTTVRELQDDSVWFAVVSAEIAARGGSLPPKSPASGVEVSQRAAAAEAYARMKAKANALRAVCAAIGGLPGRKILVLVSHRFSELAGLEFHLTGKVRYGEIPSEAREFDARVLLDSVALAANANGVTLYTFFPAGWPDEAAAVSAAAAASSNPRLNDPLEGARGDMIVQNEAAGLEPLALATGGTFTLGYRDAPALAARILEDAESSYSLGVAAPGGKPGRALDVKVAVKNRALTVRARRSAVERTPEEKVEARVLSNLFRPEPPSRLAVALGEARVESAGRTTTANLSVRIPIAALAKAQTAAGAGGAFSVFVVSASADGAFGEVVRQRRPFEIPATDLAAAEAGQFTYEIPVVLGAREARISVGVWDEVGKDAGFLLVGVKGGTATVLRR